MNTTIILNKDVDADRRRSASKNAMGPRRILADFLIGAHALQYADSLLTFDTRVYHQAFPQLAVTVLASA